MSVYDDLVSESEPTLTSMPDRKRLDEPWHWQIRLNYFDAKGEPIDLRDAKAECIVTSESGKKVATFDAAGGLGEVTIDANAKSQASVRKAVDNGDLVWSLKLTLTDGRVVQIFGPDAFGIVPEFEPFH